MTTAAMSLGASSADTLARLKWLSATMDSAWRIPGTRIRFGADSVLGLIPGVGDGIATALSLYVVAEAWRMGLPNHKLARMIGHVALDGTLGAVPIIGDVFDLMFKANTRNMRILIEHLESAKA